MKPPFTKALLLLTLLGGSVISPLSAAAAESVKIQTFQDHSRIVFAIDPSIETRLKNGSQGFEVFFKGINLSDLGAPLGEEAEWASQFSRLGDPRFSELKFAEVDGGVKVSGVWRFPEGKQALIHPQMETFDFRQSNPSSGYVVDFWVKKGSMTLAEWRAHEKEKARLDAIQKNEAAKRVRAERRLASEKRKAEVEDTTRFCREPLNEKTEIFLQLYPVHQAVEFKKYLPTTTPDELLPYFEPSGKERDAQYVRLALKLYRDGKFALVLKTLDFFNTDVPNSSYKTEMKFLRANALIKLGLQREAEEVLASLRVDAKDNPVALHAAMYLAYHQMESKNWLAATETFLWLGAHFPEHSDVWLFHLGAAEALYQLGQTDRALKEYQWVIEKAPDTATRAEGALRQSDLYLTRFEYDEALASYFRAIHYFPEQAKSFFSVHINRAEALYGLGQWDRAKEAFLAFLKDFPGNPEGWRATYRLALIEGRKEGPQAHGEMRKWFYETINSYPFSPGSTLARLNLLPCDDHGGFDLAAAEHFFNTELPAFNPSTEVQVVPLHAVETLAQVRTLISFGKEPQAVDIATGELKHPGNLDLHDKLRAALGGIFRKSILELLAAGKKYEALTFYQQKASFLPRTPGSPEETDYLLKLSQAASDLGLGNLAKEISDVYAKANTGRGVASDTSPDIESRLTASDQHFTQAKALWTAQGMSQRDAIRTQLSQIVEESPYSYERELLYGLMEQKEKAPARALSHAVRAQLLRPDPVPGAASDLRVQAWTADLQAQVGDGKMALEMYRNLENHIRLQNSSKSQVQIDETAASLGIPPVPALEVVVLAEGQLLEKQARWGEAAATYARAVEGKLGGNEALYQYARSLQKTGIAGDQAKARTVLEKLASSNGDFWTKLAQEALADENTNSIRGEGK